MVNELDTHALTALGHPGRMAVFRLLARRAPHGVRPSEIAEALQLKPNTLSAYVTTLARAGVLTTWREGRSVYYGVDLQRIGALVDFLLNDCCRGRPDLCEPLAARSLKALADRGVGATRPLAVLFVCSGNAARSQFAEAILARDAGPRFKAFSAGTRPRKRLHPEAKRVLLLRGHDVTALVPKPLDLFMASDAPRMDIAITLCDRAANTESAPLPALPVAAHWPTARATTGADGSGTFEALYDAVEERIARFTTLPIEELDRVTLQCELDAIGTRVPTVLSIGEN